MQDYSIIDELHVHPTHLTVTTHKVYDNPRVFVKHESLENLKKNIHRNFMSDKATSKCKRAINYLLLQSANKRILGHLNWRDFKFKLSFITLDLPASQMHTDNQLKRDLLNPFLINAARHWDVNLYVWRAERQKNGNLHFHIVLDKWCPWEEVRGLWNHLLNSLGYIEAYRNNQIAWHSNGFRPRPELFAHWPLKQQLKAYQYGIKTNWSDPNSTDIHSIKLVNNVSAYVTKYMTKDYICKYYQCHRKKTPLGYEAQKQPSKLSTNTLKFLRATAQVGRLWGCSYQLSCLNGGSALVDSQLREEIRIIKAHPSVKFVNEQYYSVFICPIAIAIELHCVNIVQLLSEFVTQKFILELSDSEIPIYSFNPN